MKSLVIIQRELFHYRLAFFSELEQQSYDYGFSLVVLSGSPPLHPEKANFPYKVFPKTSFTKSLDSPCWIHGMWPSLKGADIVVAMQEVKCLNNPIFWFFRSYLCKRWIWWGHGFNCQASFDPGLLRNWKEKAKQFMTPRADGLLAYTESGAKYWRERGMPPEKIASYLNTIEVEQLRDIAKDITPSELEDTKRNLKIENKSILLFSGRLYAEKRVDFLIKAFSKVKEKNSAVALLIVGHGPEREKLENLSMTLRIKDIHFLGEIIDARNVAILFKIADLLVLPGLVGLAIVHGFSFGLPLITTKHDFHSPEIDYLSPENGVMTEQNYKIYAEEILSLLSNPEKIDILRRGAVETGGSLYLKDSVRRFLEGIKSFCVDK
jgi:glycosyltransferase involved in cell wall biosynthesis